MPGPVGDVKEFLAKRKAVKKRTEKSGKVTLAVYTYVDPRSGRNCALYVNDKTYMPTKLLVTGKEAAEKITAVYTSYKLGVPIPDSTFALPKGVSVRPMPNPPKADPNLVKVKPKTK